MEREEILKLINILEEQRRLQNNLAFDPAIQAMREQLEALDKTEKPAEQRKQIVVLFADLVNFTALSEFLDAEDVNNLVNAIWKQTDQVILKYGGKIDKHLGDAVVAIWGVEQAHENDAEQAVRAAIDIQHVLADFYPQIVENKMIDQWQPKLRIGIHTGMALLSEIGTKHEFTAFGDTVNIASRVEQSAPQGGVLISHDTYQLVKGAFDTIQQPPLSVKGRNEPLRMYQVERVRPRTFWSDGRGIDGVQTKMVGRDKELQVLIEEFRNVQSGKPCSILVTGEAGLGKSRLVLEFENWIKSQADPVKVLRARAEESRSALPFGILRELFAGYFGFLEGDDQTRVRRSLENGFVDMFGEDGREKSHLISHLLGFDFSDSPFLAGILNEPQQIHNRALFHTIQWLELIGQKSPLLMLVEDLHWADMASMDWLTFVQDRLPDSPMLIVATTRPSLFESQPAWVETIRVDLQPLQPDYSRTLVQDILHQVAGMPDELLERVANDAEGNPYYIEEFIKVLVESNAIINDGDQWRMDTGLLEKIDIPTTLTGILQARLENLSRDLENVLQRSAIIGRVFWDGAVTALASQSPLDNTLNSLSELQRRGLILQSSTSSFSDVNEYLFQHTLLQGVTYGRILKKKRQEYHRKTADWLISISGMRTDEYAAMIATHLERANENLLAAEWYGRAGDAALRAYVPQTAINDYRKALQLDGNHLPTFWRIPILNNLAEALGYRNQTNESVDVYLEMLKLARNTSHISGQVQAAIGLARMYVNLGRYGDSVQIIEEVEPVARAGRIEKTELVSLLFRKGVSLYYLNRIQSAFEVSAEMLELAQSMNDRDSQAKSYGVMGMISFTHSHPHKAEEYFSKSLEIMREIGNRVTESNLLSNLGETFRQQADFNKAIEYYNQALKLARQIGNLGIEVWYLVYLGNALADISNHFEAEKILKQALEMTPPEGRYSEQFIFLARALLGLNKIDAALEAAVQGFQISVQEERPYSQGLAWRVLGEVISKADDATLPEKIQSQLNIEQPATCESCFEKSRDILEKGGMKIDLAESLWIWSLHERRIGKVDRADELRSAAREIFQSMDLELWLKII